MDTWYRQCLGCGTVLKCSKDGSTETVSEESVPETGAVYPYACADCCEKKRQGETPYNDANLINQTCDKHIKEKEQIERN